MPQPDGSCTDKAQQHQRTPFVLAVIDAGEILPPTVFGVAEA